MSDSIKRIKTNARMSQAVVAGGIVYLSGQLSDTPGAPLDVQIGEILNRIDSLLESAGSDRTRMLTASIWLSSPLLFDAFNGIWDKWVPAGNAPTRVCVTSLLMRPGLDVEVAVTALG